MEYAIYQYIWHPYCKHKQYEQNIIQHIPTVTRNPPLLLLLKKYRTIIKGCVKIRFLGFTNLQFISKLFSQAKDKPYLPWKQGVNMAYPLL